MLECRSFTSRRSTDDTCSSHRGAGCLSRAGHRTGPGERADRTRYGPRTGRAANATGGGCRKGRHAGDDRSRRRGDRRRQPESRSPRCAGGGARLRWLPVAATRARASADDVRQRSLRAWQPRAGTGHRENHPGHLVGQHGTRLGVGPGRLRGESIRSPLPGQQLLQHRAGQWSELLGVVGRDRVRQRHLGILLRNQQSLGERFHQHDAGRHSPRRDVSPRGLARAAPRDARAGPRDRGRRDRPADRPQSLPLGRRLPGDVEAGRDGAVQPWGARVARRVLAGV